MKAFAVRDVKAEGFNTPFFQQTFGLAERSLTDAMSDEKNPAARHKADYSLYYLGEFDQKTGIIHVEAEPKFICNAQ